MVATVDDTKLQPMPPSTASFASPGSAPSPPVPVTGEVDRHAAQLAAEHHFLRSVLVGMGVGMVVCAGVWVAIVVLAMIIADGPIAPMMAVGAACGVFAGMFLGGAAGAAAGVHALERAEHAGRPKLPR